MNKSKKINIIFIKIFENTFNTYKKEIKICIDFLKQYNYMFYEFSKNTYIIEFNEVNKKLSEFNKKHHTMFTLYDATPNTPIEIENILKILEFLRETREKIENDKKERKEYEIKSKADADKKERRRKEEEENRKYWAEQERQRIEEYWKAIHESL